MQRAGLRQQPLPLLQQVGDILATERLELQGVLNGAGGFVRAVDFAQRHDLADVMQRVQPPLLEFAVKRFGLRRHGQQAHQQFLIAGFAALLEQLAGMIGIFDILMPLVTARMAGDQLFLMIDAQMVWINFQGKARSGVFGGDGVGVGIEPDAELAVGADRLDDADVVWIEREFGERGFLFLEEFRGRGLGRAVAAQIGHVVEPLPSGWVEQRKVEDFQTGEEVFLDVAHGIFNAAFFMRLADAAGFDAEAVVSGEVLVARIEHGVFADGPAQDGGFQIIDHDFFGHAAEEGEGVLVASQEVLHGFGDGELDVEHPAVAEHHDEEAQAPLAVAHGDRAELAPVHLRTFARREGEREEGLSAWRPYLVNVIPDDGDAPAVAHLTQTQEDLSGGVRMCLKPADDVRLVLIEFAGALLGLALNVMRSGQPLGDGAVVQAQFAADLPHA